VQRATGLTLSALVAVSCVPAASRADDKAHATAAAAASPAAVTLLAGLVVDPASKIVFAMRDGGGLEAITSAGKTRWTTKQAEKPLWLAGGRLLAQQGTSLVILDAASGKLTKTCTAAKGTTWQPPAISANMRGSASMVGSDGGPGKAVLAWSRETHYMGGMAPTPEMSAAAASYAEGTVEVDLADCTFKELSSYTAPKVQPGKPLVAPQRVTGPAAPPQPPSVVDGVTIYVDIITAGDTSQAVLARTAAGGAELPEVDMATGKANYVHTIVSRDGRHVVSVVQDPASGGTGKFFYDHAVYDAVSGTKLGAFRMTWHAGVVIVLGDMMIEASSNTVRGVDVRTGKERWTRALRKTYYNGPLPP
jgi:hypothetical protein